jgi:hypothetical protein
MIIAGEFLTTAIAMLLLLPLSYFHLATEEFSHVGIISLGCRTLIVVNDLNRDLSVSQHIDQNHRVLSEAAWLIEQDVY